MLFLPLLTPPVFAIRAEALPNPSRFRLKLSVRNVSATPQRLWTGGEGCTNRRWSASEPSIRIEPPVETTKICVMACQHSRVLRPGETFAKVYEPEMFRRKRLSVGGRTQEYGVQPGPTVLKFTLTQPDPTAIDNRSLPEWKRYRSVLFISAPLRVNIKSAWLHG